MSTANANTSLDKGSKYPTPPFIYVSDEGEYVGERNTVYSISSVLAPGTYARLDYREWSDEWRLGCYTETPLRKSPPPQSGVRETKKLSMRGKRKIDDSCAYILKKRGGYTTIQTLTFDSAARVRLAPQQPEGPFCQVEWTRRGKPRHQRDITYLGRDGIEVLYGTTIQQEISRYIDGIAKMYQRGWVSPYQRGRKTGKRSGVEYVPITWGPFKISPIIDSEYLEVGPGFSCQLDYLWVAENPLNENGERNPHVHLLMRWEVPKAYFPTWAKRLEKLWGQGFAHIERLRDRSAAGYYLAKAAGYLTKGSKTNDQGPIRGNRYGISKSARAPEWQSLSFMEWGTLGESIQKAKKSYSIRLDPIRKERATSQKLLSELPLNAKKARRHTLKRLTVARNTLKGQKVWFGRNHIVVKGIDRLDRFMCWAEEDGWCQNRRPDKGWFAGWKQVLKNGNYWVKDWRHAWLSNDVKDIETAVVQVLPLHKYPCYILNRRPY